MTSFGLDILAKEENDDWKGEKLSSWVFFYNKTLTNKRKNIYNNQQLYYKLLHLRKTEKLHLK